MKTRKNVPAPEGHVCNETHHDDAAVSRIKRHAESIREDLEGMFSEQRQQDTLAMVARMLEITSRHTRVSDVEEAKLRHPSSGNVEAHRSAGAGAAP